LSNMPGFLSAPVSTGEGWGEGGSKPRPHPAPRAVVSREKREMNIIR